METYHHIYSSRSPSSQSPSSRSPSSVVGDGGAGLEEEERCGRGREGKDGHKEPGHKVYIIFYIRILTRGAPRKAMIAMNNTLTRRATS